MKIALVSPYDFAVPGGVNNHIEHLRDNFLRLGQEVRIIAPSSRPSSHKPEEMVIPIGRAVGIPASGSVARVTLSLRLAPKVKRVLQEERFDIIHVHEPFAPFLPMQVLRLSDLDQRRDVPRREGRRQEPLVPLRPPRPQALVPAPATARSPSPCRRCGWSAATFPATTTSFPTASTSSTSRRSASRCPQYSDGRPNVLFVGRLEKRKGVKYLLQAFAEVKKEMPEPRLLIVGPPTRAARGYHRWVAETGLPDVEFIGYVTYDDLARYHHTADVVVAPATGNESQGIVLLEAMAAGRPLVASNIEGYASVVTHGVEGLLVTPKDAHALAAALAGAAGRPGAGGGRWPRTAGCARSSSAGTACRSGCSPTTSSFSMKARPELEAE